MTIVSSGGCSRSWSRSTGRIPGCCPRSGTGWLRSSSCTRRPRRRSSTRSCCRWGWPRTGRPGWRERRSTPSRTTTRSGTRSLRSHAIRWVPTSGSARSQAANLANSDHMAEEEREGLTDFRRLAESAAPPSARGRVRRLRSAELRRGPRRGQGPGHVRARGGGRGARAPEWIPQHRQPQAGLTGPGVITPAGPGVRGCGGPWSCPCSRRWWCRRGSGPGSSPSGGSRPGGGTSTEARSP